MSAPSRRTKLLGLAVHREAFIIHNDYLGKNVLKFNFIRLLDCHMVADYAGLAVTSFNNSDLKFSSEGNFFGFVAI